MSLKPTKEFVIRNRGSLLLAVVLVAIYVIENINGRFWLNDFKVYYSAASMLMNGGNIYGEAFGLSSGYYKYSPFASLFFIPFSLLEFKVAASVYYFIVAGLVLYVLNATAEMIVENSGSNSKKQQLVFFGFIIGVVHFQRELHLGNVNVLLLALLLISIKGILEYKTVLPSLLLGIAILFKPHFLILMPLLFLYRRYKVLAVTFVVVVVGVLLPAVLFGIGKDIEMHSQWLTMMRTHNAGIADAEQTIYFLVNHYLLRFFVEDGKVVFIVSGMILLAPLLLLFIQQRKKGLDMSGKDFMLNSFLLLALIPSITLTDTEHFLLSLPLIMVLVYWAKRNTRTLLFKVILGIGIVMYGGNIHDLIGGDASNWVLRHGLLGMGNLVLIFLFVYARAKKGEEPNILIKE